MNLAGQGSFPARIAHLNLPQREGLGVPVHSRFTQREEPVGEGAAPVPAQQTRAPTTGQVLASLSGFKAPLLMVWLDEPVSWALTSHSRGRGQKGQGETVLDQGAGQGSVATGGSAPGCPLYSLKDLVIFRERREQERAGEGAENLHADFLLSTELNWGLDLMTLRS